MNNFDMEFNGMPRGLPPGRGWNTRVQDMVLDATGTSATPGTQEMELVRLLKVIWTHKFLVLAITMACAAVGLGVALLQTPMYRANATIELLGINQNFLNQREVDPHASSSDAGGSDAYIATEVELLRSEALIKRVIEKLGMANRPTPSSGLRSLLHLGAKKPPSTDAVVGRVLKNLRVEQV